MGSTEAGAYGLKLFTKEDWMYYRFNPLTGLRMIPFSEQGDLFESVILGIRMSLMRGGAVDL